MEITRDLISKSVIENCLDHYDKGNYKKALICFKSKYKYTPHPTILNYIITCFLQLEEYEELFVSGSDAIEETETSLITTEPTGSRSGRSSRATSATTMMDSFRSRKISRAARLRRNTTRATGSMSWKKS